MRSSLRMRSSLVVRASDCQCTSCNGPGFDPSIRRHSGIWGAADEAVLNIVWRKNRKNPPKKYLKKKYCQKLWFFQTEQSDVVFINFQIFHVAFVWKGCFIEHLFGNAPFWSAIVAESTVMEQHRCWWGDEKGGGGEGAVQPKRPLSS
jgi:hypothetical protein